MAARSLRHDGFGVGHRHRNDGRAVVWLKRAESGALRRQRIVQTLGELGVAIKQGLNPEMAKDAESRLLRQRGEPDR